MSGKADAGKEGKPKDKKVFQNRTRILLYFVHHRKLAKKLHFNKRVREELGISASSITEELNFLKDGGFIEDTGHHYRVTKAGVALLRPISALRTISVLLLPLMVWLVFRVMVGFSYGGIPLIFPPLSGEITVAEMLTLILLYGAIAWVLYRYPLILASRRMPWTKLGKGK